MTRTIASTILVVSTVLAARPVLAQTPPAPILVMPFVVDAHASDNGGAAYWLGEGAAILISDELRAQGLGGLTHTERVDAFDRAELPMTETLTRATLIRVGEFIGARDVVSGTVTLGDVLIVHARMVRLATGEAAPEVVDQAPASEIFALFQRVGAKLAAETGSVVAETPVRRASPPMPAFEDYVKGLVAPTAASRQRFLEAALKQAPRDDRVLIALWGVYSTEGAHDRALAAAREVPPDSPRSRRARFDAALSLMDLTRYDEAFRTLDTLHNERPSAIISNALGVIQLRRGSTPVTGTPVFFFNRAADEDPENATVLFNLGYAYALARDANGALYWLRDAVRHQPADGDAHLLLSAVLASTGKNVEAQRELDLANLLGAKSGANRASATDAVPAHLERLLTDVDAAPAPRDAALNSEQEDAAVFHLDRGRRLFAEEDDRGATDELKRAIYLSPYQDESHLLLGRVYLRDGRVQQAIDEFKIAIWSRESPEACVALGDAYLANADKDDARREAERALTLDPASAAAKDLLKRIG